MSTKFLRFLAALVLMVPSLSEAQTKTNNLENFEESENGLRPGHWAYGWFSRGGINHPDHPLELFQEQHTTEVVNVPNWTADSKKTEVAWTICVDGRTFVDSSDIVWIYKIPEEMAGKQQISSELLGQTVGRSLRIYLVSDEDFSKEDRKTLKPVAQTEEGNFLIETVTTGKANELLLFVINDTTESAQWWLPSILDARVEVAK